ncbi:MAG: rhomboid family intramembrane serine protease [Planctomycetota bacterium]
MILPYNVDVGLERWPIANWALIVVTCLVSLAAFPGLYGDAPLEIWVLSGDGPWSSDLSLIGSVFTHADIFHLLGNMIFLFVFGNAVNAKLGHSLYIACYLLMGAFASAASAAMSANALGLGASGAISGVTGMFIVFFPRNNVSVFYWFGVLVRGVAYISSWIVIGAYFAKDFVFELLFQTTGVSDGVGHAAHLGGTFAGLALASGLLLTDRVRSLESEENLLEKVGLLR